MPGIRATSSSVILMIALGLVGKPLRRRSSAEYIWERRRRCLRRRPMIIKATARDVRPTPPAIIPAIKPRLIAIAYRALCRRAARITPSPLKLDVRYPTLASTARVARYRRAPFQRTSTARVH